jgi:hypothetical protein
MKSSLLSLLAIVLMTATAGAQAVDPNARNMHVFPQVADGVFGDGSEYATTFVVTNVSAGFASCTIGLTGMTSAAGRLATTNFGVPLNGIAVVETTGTLAGDTGYAVLNCSLQVTAMATYSRSLSGTAEGKATVFSTAAMNRSRVPVIQGGGSRMGVAIINDTIFQQTYTLTLFSADGNIIAIRSLPIEGKGQRVGFVDESTFFSGNVPGEGGARFEGSIVVSNGGQFYAVGLLFEGGVFTTVPFSIF